MKHHDVSLQEVNPARAGMIPAAGPPGSPARRKPRASGDDPEGVLVISPSEK